MEKYNAIMKQLVKEHKTRTSPIDDLYVMGICHAIQSISLNDATLTREEYGKIYATTEMIIKELINL